MTRGDVDAAALDAALDAPSTRWRRWLQQWWRRPDRLRLAYVVVIAGAFLVTAVARSGGDTTGSSALSRRAGHPAVTAVQPLPAACVVATTGVPGCNVTPAEAAQYLGFTPERPAEIPPGIHLVSQDLRGIGAAETSAPSGRSTGYFQRWAPVGALPGDAGNYQQYLQLRERAVVAGETTDCGPQSIATTLGNGLRACVGTTAATVSGPVSGAAPGDASPTPNTVIVWTSNGVWNLLEGAGVSREQLLQFAASFPG
jgi:hypothetical protein